MRSLFSLVISIALLLACGCLRAQSTTWTGNVNFDFQNSGNWTFNVPVNNSSVIIPADVASSIVNVPTITLNNLTINGNCTFEGNLTAPAAALITVTGNLTVAATKTFSFGATNARISFLLATGATGTVAGSIVINSGMSARYFQNDGDLTLTSTGVIAENGASQFTMANASAILRIGSPDGITNAPSTLGNIQTTTRTFSGSASYAYVGSGVQNTGDALPGTISNLLISNAGGVVNLGQSISISNTLTLTNGSLDLGNSNITSVNAVSITGSSVSASGSGTLSLNGDITSGFSLTPSSISSPILLGGANRTIAVANGGLPSDMIISGAISGGFGVVKSGTGVLTLSGNSSFSGSVTISAGTLKLGATGSAGFGPLGTTASNTVVSSGASLDLSGFSLANNESIAISGNGYLGTGAITNSGSAATYSGTITLAGACTIASNGGAVNLTNNISGSSALVLAGTAGGSVTGQISIGANSVTKNGTGTWVLSANNSFTGGFFQNAGTLVINNPNALGATAGTFTIAGGSIDNSGAITLASYPISIIGNFSFIGSNPINLGTGPVSFTGNRQITVTNSALTIGGTVNASLANITKAGPGVLSFSSSNVSVNSLSINAGELVAPSATLSIAGDFANSGVFTNNGGTVNFSGNASQNVSGATFQTVNFTGSGQKNLTSGLTATSLTNNSVVNVGVFTLNASIIVNTSGTIRFSGASNGFAINTGTVEYNGASQTVGGGNYLNLIVNQSSGDANLGAPSQIDGNLLLQSGNFNLGNKQLTIGLAGTISGAGPPRFLIATSGGQLRKIFSGPGSFSFPVGDNIGALDYSPLSLNFTTAGGPGFVSVAVTDSKHPDNNSPNHYLARFWTVTTGSSGNADLSAFYPATSVVGTEVLASGALLTGAFNIPSNIWQKFLPLSAGSFSINAAALSSSQPNIITGIIGSNPVTNAGTDKTICNGASTGLGGSPSATGGAGGFTYSWSPVSNLSSPSSSNPSFSATTPSTVIYNLTVTDANGFTSSDDVSVLTNPIPVPSVVGLNSVCQFQTGVTYITPSSGNLYSWTIVNGTIDSGAATNNISVTWPSLGTGVLQLTETIPVTLCSVTTPVFNVAVNANPNPSISGTSIVCAGQSGVMYLTAPNANRSYSWSVAGGVITSGLGTNSIVVQWGASGTGTVNVTEAITTSGCARAATTFNVTINPTPSPLISGSNSVCSNQLGLIYSTPATGNQYLWSITGGNITSSTTGNAITVDWVGPASGTLVVKENNPLTGCATNTSPFNVIINLAPAPSIVGSASVCAGQNNVSYSTTFNSGRSYAWTVTGGTISSGAGTSNILVNWLGAGSGSVALTETVSATGCSTVAIPTAVTINPNPNPNITGSSTVCATSTAVPYTTLFVAGHSYFWTVTGGSIASGAGTNSITVDWGAGPAGSVRVTQTSAASCSTNSPTLNVTINPLPTPVISGPALTCAGRTGVNYSTPLTAGRTFAWNLVGGTGGSTTNSINVNWGGVGSGSVRVTETITATGCQTTTAPYAVVKDPNPAPAISGSNIACVNQSGLIYSTPFVAGNSYAWSFPAGGGVITAGAGTEQVTVTWTGNGARQIRVVETSPSGPIPPCNAQSTFNVTVNVTPAPVISGNNTVCSGQSGVVYTVPFNAGRSYNWSISGGSITAGLGTASITVTWGAAGAGTLQLTEAVISTGCNFTTPVYNVLINPSPTPSITGLSLVCTGQTGVVYSTSPSGNTFNWVVLGGSITSGLGTNSITVSWGAVGTGTVTLTETIASTGCSITTSPLSVTKSAVPTPFISGSNNVCEFQTNSAYSTPFSVGRSYAWTVTGGTIVSGAGTASILVNWNAAGTGTVQLTESIVSTSCLTTTPVFNVLINPRPTPVISGVTTTCASQTNSYSTINTGNLMFWSVSGGNIVSGGNSSTVTVNWISSGTGTLTLTEISLSTGCVFTTAPYNVNINPLPVPLITGSNTVCSNESAKIYSTPFVAGNTYLWTASGGLISGSSTNNSVSINWGAAGAGLITLTETNSTSGCSKSVNLSVLINATPAPVVSGSTSVCSNQTGVPYSTPLTAGNFYSWTISGGTIASGVGTNSIVVNWGAIGTGTLSVSEVVVATNCSVASVPISVSINAIPTPVISGSNTVCANDVNKIYSTPSLGGRSYNWSVIGGTIAGPNTNNSVSINWGSAGLGILSLEEIVLATGCSSGILTYNVNINNLPAPSISGLTTVCAAQTGVAYSTPNVVGNSYTWGIAGGTITSGLGTNSVLVNWGSTGVGQLTVTEFIPASSCLTVSSPYNVIVNPIPSPIISGNNTVCEGEQKIYSTPFNLGNTYSWVVSGGTINGSSTSNVVTVDWTSSGAGLLRVVESAGCTSVTPDYNVTINTIPSPSISGLVTVCANQSGVSYNAPLVSGVSYAWSVIGGALITGAGTNSITVNWGTSLSGSIVLTETNLSSGCSKSTSPYVVAISAGVNLDAGADFEVCDGLNADLGARGPTGIAMGSNFSSLVWSGGAGSFSNPTILNPVYSPGPTETGLVVLTLTATGLGVCPSVVDQVNLTITPKPLVNAGSDAQICQGSTFGFFGQTVLATAANFSSLQWTQTGGTGMLFNANTLQPTYQSSATDAGNIIFTLTAISTGSCVAVTDVMILHVSPPPVLTAGANIEVCQGTSVDLNLRSTLASAASVSSMTWSGGAGAFSNPSVLNPVYTPLANEVGVVTLTLTGVGLGACASSSASMQIAITPAVQVSAGSNAEICEGLNFSFALKTPQASVANASSFAWSGSGTGTLLNSTTLNPTYIPALGETGLVNFALQANGLGSCASKTSSFSLFITPSPAISAGIDTQICSGSLVDLATRGAGSTATAANFNFLSWTGGSGSFSNSASLNPIYVPAGGEVGLITLTVIAFGNGSCPSVQDQMVINLSPQVVVSAGSDEQICGGSLFNFASQSNLASVANTSSIVWTHNGTGTLFNATTITPVYQSGANETGSVNFNLQANGIAPCLSSSDAMQLIIQPPVQVSAGIDFETCQGTTALFSTRSFVAQASNFSSINWTHNGLGTITNETTLNPSYSPAVAETGNITFTLTAAGIGPCISKQSQVVLKITPQTLVDAGSDLQVCEGSAMNFSTQTVSASSNNASSVLWTHNGTGTLTNATSLAPAYIPGFAETGNIVFTFKGFSVGSCPSIVDQMQGSIVPGPKVFAGSDAEICEGVPTFNLSSRSASANIQNGTISWSHSGGGAIFPVSSLNPTYTISPLDVGITIPFTLTVTSPSSVCPPVQDSFTLKVNPLPVVNFFGLPSAIGKNGAPVLVTGNLSGGLFTVQPSTSNLGSTFQNPLDFASFDPNAASLGKNTITYSFTDSKGCKNSISKDVTVNPVTVVDFSLQYQSGPNANLFVPTNSLGEFEICNSLGLVKILGNPDVSTGLVPSNFVAVGPNASTLQAKIIQSGFNFFIDTNGLPSGLYAVQYTYTNVFGITSNPFTRNVRVFASPVAVIKNLANSCLTSSISFQEGSFIPPTPYTAQITSWTWDFGNNISANQQTPVYQYASPGSYTVKLTVTSSQGCAANAIVPIRVGIVPNADFSWAGVCNNQFTAFTDKTVLSTNAKIVRYGWNFGDSYSINNLKADSIFTSAVNNGTTKGSAKSPQHQFPTQGSYPVTMSIVTDEGCLTTVTKKVFILPAGIGVSPTPNNPYTESFNSSSGNWIPESLRSDTLSVSWLWGIPRGKDIVTNPSIQNAWWTGKNIIVNGRNSYFDNENSALNGPCFDLSKLTRPMISLDFWSDAEVNLDGAVLQYSIDGGFSWRLLGPLEGFPNRDQGINWYNGQSIRSNPGLQPQFGPYGWTGKLRGWKNAAFNLDMIPVASRGEVRFRLAFSSNDTNATGADYDGFAFDNVYIGDKVRRVLLEHFTNTELPGTQVADSYVNNLLASEINLRGTSNVDFNMIQYHISYPSSTPDLLNLDNPSDPNSRAANYGVARPPKTFFDGIRNAKFDGSTIKINSIEVDRRALKNPWFRISLDTIPTNNPTKLSARMTITADTLFNSSLIAQVALVEDDVVLPSGIYKNVLKKLLFGSDPTKPDGILINQPWMAGQRLVLPNPANEVDINVRIYNPRKLKLIGFIQDKNTGEIYQSESINLPPKTNSVINEISAPIIGSTSISIYPNPAKSKFNLISSTGAFDKSSSWFLIDPRGRVVLAGDFNHASEGAMAVDARELAAGVYVLRVLKEGECIVSNRLVLF